MRGSDLDLAFSNCGRKSDCDAPATLREIGIRDAAAKRAQTIIMTQVTRELSGQYEKLPDDQKQVLQEIICLPAQSGKPASPSATP